MWFTGVTDISVRGERESVYLTSIQCKAVQTVAGTIKASGARSVHQKGSL